MADPNESHRDNRAARQDMTSDTSDPGTPEVVDAELVEEPPETHRTTRAGDVDDEQFRQYQQFLEFQKFQEWQRQQAGTAGADATPPPTAPPPQATAGPGRPWWRKALRLLRFKLVRRLLYLVLILLLLSYAIDYYFGDSDSSGGGGTGGVPPKAAPVAPGSPQRVVRALYNYIANQPGQACALFTETGKAAFAASHGTGDCTTAANQARAAVTTPASYGNPNFSIEVIQQTGQQALVDSCDLGVSGGPPLGRFRMSRQPNGGWQIDQYENPSCG